MLDILLKREFTPKRDSVASIYVYTKFECNRSKEAIEEMIDCLSLYERLSDHQVFHLIHVLNLVYSELNTKELIRVLDKVQSILLDVHERFDIKVQLLELLKQMRVETTMLKEVVDNVLVKSKRELSSIGLHVDVVAYIKDILKEGE